MLLGTAICLVVMAVPVDAAGSSVTAPHLATAPPLPGITLQSAIPSPPSVSLPVVASAVLGASWGIHHRLPFYAIEFNDFGLGPNAATDLGLFFNSTPLTWFRLGEGGIGYDPTTQTNYQAPTSGTQFVGVSENMMNLTWFRSWCYSRTPHCHWIASLPAEENNTTAAVHFAEYFHNVLNFPPTAWEMGNEPNVWTHYGENVTTWQTTDDSTPTGVAYATMVHNYIAAVSKLFPSDKFIGIQSNCACGPDLVTTTAQVDGPQLFSMAYHSYPWTNDSSVLPSQFMGALQSTRNLSYTANRMRQLIANGCSTCSGMPIEVGEYNAGPVPVHSPLAMNYSGAPFMAASVIEALQANVSMLTLYSLSWLYNSSSTAVNPEGLLYQRILNNMTMGQDFNVTVSAPGVGGIYGVLIKNGARESLLIVNTNITKAITVTVPLSILASGLTGSVRSWDPRSAYPTVQTGVLLPLTYTVWSQGILLVNNY